MQRNYVIRNNLYNNIYITRTLRKRRRYGSKLKSWMKFSVQLPSSSVPIMLYRSNPLRLRSLPSPKSSLVHWSTPALLRTRQAITTVSPTTAVWSSGSRSNLCTDRNDWPEFCPFETPTQPHKNATITSDHLKTRVTMETLKQLPV